ncbi:MAG: HRDC domain-containing protein [Micropruina sp.]
MSAENVEDSAEASPLTPLTEPADGVPDVVDTPEALDRALSALVGGSGPLAVDTERAQSYRYSGKAYLLQLRRAGAGTVLLDPIAFESAGATADFSAWAEALTDAEWIVHAASQDLPCLAEIQLLPSRLFDTELAARLLGLPRVGLGTMMEEVFGLSLRKEHSAADWSRRPLPLEWLTYAALDVEMLIQLRDHLAGELEAAGKAEWARQEFAHLVANAATPAAPRIDPWRRTSGLHSVRTPAALALVRELWQARDELARRTDRAPGRLLPDRAISLLATRLDAPGVRRLGPEDLAAVKEFSWRHAARYRANWLAAMDRTASLTRSEHPPRHLTPDGPPPTRLWAAKDPAAAVRWEAVRPAVTALAEAHDVPQENLITPDYLRRLAWAPPTPTTAGAVDDFLAELGARPWQRELVVPVVTPLLTP